MWTFVDQWPLASGTRVDRLLQSIPRIRSLETNFKYLWGICHDLWKDYVNHSDDWMTKTSSRSVGNNFTWTTAKEEVHIFNFPSLAIYPSIFYFGSLLLSTPLVGFGLKGCWILSVLDNDGDNDNYYQHRLINDLIYLKILIQALADTIDTVT